MNKKDRSRDERERERSRDEQKHLWKNVSFDPRVPIGHFRVRSGHLDTAYFPLSTKAWSSAQSE